MTAVFFGRGEGQRAAVVLEQHHRLVRSVAGRRPGRPRVRKLAGSVAFVWSTYGWSKRPARNFTRRMRLTASLSRDIEIWCCGEQLLAVVADVRADHLRVGAGVERQRTRGRTVGRDTVAARPTVRLDPGARPQLGDGGVVGLDEAVEAPLLLEDLGLGVVVRAAGDAVDRVERAHRGVRTRVHRGLERRQVEVAQRGLGHVGGVVLAAALGRAVGREVLHAGGDLVRRRVVAALVTLDPGRGERRHRGTGPRRRPRRSGPSVVRARRRPSGCRPA